MSQQLVPINGGTQILETTVSTPRAKVLSPQAVSAKNLQSRPTEWVPSGRPIYRRLPAISETYQINFFDILPATNTAVRIDEPLDVGYVYIPWGEGIFGPFSLDVVSSPTNEDLIVKSGAVVWKYGTTFVPPAILNLRELDFESGRYLLTYQLVYDNAPSERLYQVEDYALTGTELEVGSSSDSIVGWRYPAINALLNSTKFWSNRDSYFDECLLPSQAFLSWENTETYKGNTLASAYSKIILRCPPGTSFSGTATLSYSSGTVQTVTVSEDIESQYFQFDIATPSFQTYWKVNFSEVGMKIRAIVVSGIVTKLAQQVEPSTQCALSIYPANAVPSTIINSEGEKIPANYCDLAYFDVDANFKLTDITDVRSIIHRDYTPVADWLTRPFDESLISFYEQVKDYPNLWMKPETCMQSEYANLEKYGVEVIQ